MVQPDALVSAVDGEVEAVVTTATIHHLHTLNHHLPKVAQVDQVFGQEQRRGLQEVTWLAELVTEVVGEDGGVGTIAHATPGRTGPILAEATAQDQLDHPDRLPHIRAQGSEGRLGGEQGLPYLVRHQM